MSSGDKYEVSLLEHYGKDRMGSRRRGVHLGGRDRPVVVTLVVLFLDLIVGTNGNLRQAFDEDSGHSPFAHLESSLGSAVGRREEILNVLVVNLQHAHRHLKLGDAIWLLRFRLDSREDLLAGTRHNSRVCPIAHDRVAFSRASLPIRE